MNKTYRHCGFPVFDACFKRFTRGLDTYANASSRNLTHSWSYVPGFVERILLP